MKYQKKKRNNSPVKTFVVLFAVISLFVGLIGFNTFSSIATNATHPSAERSTRDIAMSCTTDMATQFHIHPHLDIIIDGQKQEVPASIGISLTCMHPLHTHDNSGTIHVESPEKRDFTLGDFFAVWGQTFSRNQILNAVADQDHEIVMTVDGAPSDQYENLVVQDQQKVVIEYRAKSGSESSTTLP